MPNRRDLIKMLGAAAALPACDNVNVDVTDKPGAADSNGMLPITPTAFFYVYQNRDPPSAGTYDPDDWSMDVRVKSAVVATLTADYFAQQTPIEFEHTLQCIGGNPRNTLINNSTWGGLPFVQVLADLGVDIPGDTVELMMEGADRTASGLYNTSVPWADVTEERVWLVWEQNGEALNFDHGKPCRFIVQGRYGTKNVKWPTFVNIVSEPFRGYWERLNWSNEATYRVNGFILSPADGTDVVAGSLIFGTAFAGDDPIANVEITFDDGRTWVDTEIYYSPGADRWTLWRYTYDGPKGDVVARLRVTTVGGETTVGPEGSDQALGYDGGMEVAFEVT